MGITHRVPEEGGMELPRSQWASIPDNALLLILYNLQFRDVVHCSGVCSHWHNVAQDEFLWRHVFCVHWRLPADTSLPRGRVSWKKEFIRLQMHTPVVESEVIREHTDQVIHVAFSNNGRMFSTCSKDGFVRVWNALSVPCSLKYLMDMKKYTWQYTQFSQFNQSDTLLLVSGVHIGHQSTSGEIVVFNLRGEFTLQARVLNKPYDIFGTWVTDSYLLSGNYHLLGRGRSCSILWLNKANQEIKSESESVVLRLFKLVNENHSSIRMIKVARNPLIAQYDSLYTGNSVTCAADLPPHHRGELNPTFLPLPDPDQTSNSYFDTSDNISDSELSFFSTNVSRARITSTNDQPGCSYAAADGDVSQNESPIKGQSSAPTTPEDSDLLFWSESQNPSSPESSSDSPRKISLISGSSDDEQRPAETLPAHLVGTPTVLDSGDSVLESVMCQCLEIPGTPGAGQDDDDEGVLGTTPVQGRVSPQESAGEETENERMLSGYATDTEGESIFSFGEGDVESLRNSRIYQNTIRQQQRGANMVRAINEPVYLVFTTGSRAFVPHQLGLKRINPEMTNVSLGAVPTRLNEHEFDDVDHVIEFDGHIVGIELSPDHRYAYVNVRKWAAGWDIRDPMAPPPISNDVTLHVVDLVTREEVRPPLVGHRAFTPNYECFFVFLAVTPNFVGSGAEDQHAYIWERQYGCLLTTLRHKDVVSSVAFNPADEEMAVTVSDDHSVKVWRSRNHARRSRLSAAAAAETRKHAAHVCPDESSESDNYSE